MSHRNGQGFQEHLLLSPSGVEKWRDDGRVRVVLIRSANWSWWQHFYFHPDSLLPGMTKKVQYRLLNMSVNDKGKLPLWGPICLREACLLTDIFSIPYCTFIIVTGGLELVAKLKWCHHNQCPPLVLCNAIYSFGLDGRLESRLCVRYWPAANCILRSQ